MINQELAGGKSTAAYLSNRRLNLFNNDPAYWIPAGVSVENTKTMALTDVQANTHQSFGDSCAVAFYVGGAMDVQIEILVHNSINGGGCPAFDVVKGEKPPHATVFATGDANITHVNYTEVCVWGSLGEWTFL